MSNAESVLPANSLLSGQPYYPLMLSSSTGQGVSGTDSQLSYQSGTLTTPNLDVVNINGSPYIAGITGIDTIFPKINLSSTWVAYGDSFTAGGGWSPIWATYLASLTGKTLINKAVSGTTSDYASVASAATNDPVLTPAYANYGSIVMYGFNDVRNNKTLYTNFYAWTQNILSLALTLSVPQNKIELVRDVSWTKSGTWTNSPVYNFGVFTSTQGDYIQKNIGTCRYIAVRHTMIFNGPGSVPANWELRVNGVVVNTFTWITIPIGQAGFSHITGAYVVDLGSDTPNCVVRLTNNASGGAGLNNFVDFVAGWTSADLVTARPVLLLSIPRFNFEFTGASPFDQPTDAKRIQMNESFEHVAKMCRQWGLPVSFYRINEAQGNFYTDNIHPDTNQSRAWAKEIFENALI